MCEIYIPMLMGFKVGIFRISPILHCYGKFHDHVSTEMKILNHLKTACTGKKKLHCVIE